METDDPARPGPGLRMAAVIGVLGVIGVLAGVVWWVLWEPSYYVVTLGQGAMAEPDLGRRFAADGWFAVIGAVVGLITGAVVTWRFRRGRLLGLLALVLGSLLGVAAMRLTGALLGPDSADPLLAAADEGARVPVELTVIVPGFHLVWPIAALFAACAVLWGGTDRRRPVVDPTDAPSAHHPDPWGPPSYPPHEDPDALPPRTR